MHWQMISSNHLQSNHNARDSLALDRYVHINPILLPLAIWTAVLIHPTGLPSPIGLSPGVSGNGFGNALVNP